MKKTIIWCCAFLVLLIVSFACRAFGAPGKRTILVVGDKNDLAVARMEIELRARLSDLRDQGKFDIPGFSTKFQGYDFAIGRHKETCRALGIRKEDLPFLGIVAVDSTGRPARVLWKVRVDDLENATAALMRQLGGTSPRISALPPAGPVSRPEPVLSPQQTTVTFTFIVVDAGSRSGISDASVWLDGSFQDSTGSDGRVGVLTTYPPGNHSWNVSASGYQDARGYVSIGSNSGGSYTVRLTRSAPQQPPPQKPDDPEKYTKANINDKEAFISYSRAISNIAQLESRSMDKYNECRQMAKAGRLSDTDFCRVLGEEVVPAYEAFVDRLKGVRTPNQELMALHRFYLNGAGSQLAGLHIMIGALRESDISKVREANQLLQLGTNQINEWSRNYGALKTKYGF